MTLVGLAARKLAQKQRSAKLAAAFPNGIRCQKCLNMGHWSYECKEKRKFVHRNSRTKQLKKHLEEKGTNVSVPESVGSSETRYLDADREIRLDHDKRAKRKRKHCNRSSSSSSSDSSNSSSDSSNTDSSSSDSESSSSDENDDDSSTDGDSGSTSGSESDGSSSSSKSGDSVGICVNPKAFKKKRRDSTAESSDEGAHEI